MAPTSTTKTKRIAGHSITLTTGERYVAGRPFCERGRTEYPVSINRHAEPFGEPVAVVHGLSYDAANHLLLAFNNGALSFDGRVW